MATFNMCLLTPQGNALLWSQFVLGLVQQNSNFGSSDHRLKPTKNTSFAALPAAAAASAAAVTAEEDEEVVLLLLVALVTPDDVILDGFDDVTDLDEDDV